MRNAKPSESRYAKFITINADCTIEEIHNFWNHIHFHPTDAIEDEWGKHILNQVSMDSVAQYIRIYAMLEDIVDRDEKGNLIYNFTDTDRRLDYLTEKGFHLLICFNFLPKVIAADPECMSWLPRYKGKYINTSKPGNYKEWQEVCYAYTMHLKDRYGEERLSKWYFHCWNEPDFPDYFLSDVPRGEILREKRKSPEEDNMVLAAKEYAKLYDHFAEGVTRACNAAKIGGPSAALSNQFIELFLQHITDGINWANGKKGSRFDFLSIHTYGMFPKDLTLGKPVQIESTYNRVKELEALAIRCGIKKPEIIVDEWGLSTEGFTDMEKCPFLEFRNTEFYPAAYAHLINYYTRKHAPVKLQMICLSGQHNLKKEFHGYRSFFTLHGFPKPIYNGYALCAKLGNRLLESRELTSWEENRDGSIIGVLPTSDQNGRIAVLIYRFSPNMPAESQIFRERTSQLVHLNLSGLHGAYRIRHYRIDHGNCNSYTLWREIGGRNNLNQAELEWIRKEGRLKPLYPEENQKLHGKWQQDIVMPDNAVSLIELKPNLSQ